MKELAYKSLNQVTLVIPGQNPANLKARLDQQLPPEMGPTFAKVKLDTSNAYWFGDDNIEYHPFSDASGTERAEIGLALGEVKNLLTSDPKLREEFPFAEDLFIVPDNQAVFWYKDNGGKVRPVLTQWAFKERNAAQNVGLIDMLISDAVKQQQDEVTLHIVYTNGQPADDCPFKLFIFNNEKEERTDENGTYHLGKLLPGKTFAIEDMEGRQRHEFVVEQGASYTAIFKLETNWSVTVKNQLDHVKPNFRLKIGEKEYTTDHEGKVSFENYLMDGQPVTVALENGGNPLNYELSRNPEENNFIFRVEDELPQPPYKITLRYFDGSPLKNFSFQVVPADNEAEAQPVECRTDDNGVAVIPDGRLKPGKFKINLTLSKEQKKAIEAEIKKEKELRKQQKKESKKNKA